MQSLSLYSSAEKNASTDLAQELLRLQSLLAERRVELLALQEELRAFKARYTQIVGSRLAELAEVERAIKEAERHTLGTDERDEEETETTTDDAQESTGLPVKTTLRKLFWSV